MNTAQIPPWFLDTPVGREAVAQAKQQTEDRRKEQITQLVAIETQRIERLSRTDPGMKKAQAEVSRCEAALLAARERLQTVAVIRASANHTADRQKMDLEKLLRQTAPEVIAETYTAWSSEIDKLRKTQPSTKTVTRGEWPLARSHRYSNESSINARTEGLMSALRQLDVVATTYATAEEASAEIGRLYDAISQVGEPVEISPVTGEPL